MLNKITPTTKRFCFLTLFLLAALVDSAIELSVRHFGKSDGLPNRQVYDLQTDDKGFVWIYTLSGLARYDGREIRHYPLTDVDQSRDNIQSATTMGLTPDGYIWVCIKSGQVYAYNPDSDNVEMIFDFAAHGLPDRRIYNVVFDDDSMMLCTSDGIFSVKNDSVRPYALGGVAVYGVLRVDTDNLFAATDQGISHISRSQKGETVDAQIPASENMHFKTIAYSAGKLIGGTFSGGLYSYDPSTRSFTAVLPEIPSLPVNALSVVDDSTLCAGVDGAGVYIIDTPSMTLKHHLASGDGGGLSANTISDICVDQSGGLWISTSTHGINYLSPGNGLTKIDNHTTNHALPSDYVMSVFEDRDGELWYGTDKGLSMKDKNGQWHHYLTTSGISDVNIQSISQSDDGIIWAGGYGSGVWSIDKRSGTTKKLPLRSGDSGVGTEYVFTTFPDGDDVWFGGIEGDITRYNRIDNTYSYYPAECAGDIMRATDGSLYITGCGGIGLFDSENDSIVWVQTLGDIELSHPTHFVMHDPETGELWFATDGDGIVRYNPATDKASRLDLSSTVSSLSIDGIAKDDRGRVWFCTDSELYYIDSGSGEIVNMTSLLGYGEVSILPGTLTVTHDGKIVVGTSDGAVTATPEHDKSYDLPPAIIFTDLMVNHERVEPGSKTLPVAIDRTDRIVLSHDRNDIAVSFSAIDLSGSKNIRYQWMLEGRDDAWWDADNSFVAEFRNLPSGHYTLVVRAVDAVSGQVLARRSLEIEVRPPLWLTWWAITAYLIALVAIGFIALRYLRRRQHERRVAEKLQSFLNIVHDLRTPLTLIKAPLGEVESQDNLPDETRRNVNLAMKNVERLLGMVSRLLDLRRESNHSDCLNLSETSLHDYLESKAAEYRVAAIQKKLTLKVEVDESLPLVKMDCNKISHILDNLLSNAIKYTFSGGVTVKAWCDRSNWTISVADTGIGIPRSDRRSLFVNQFRGTNAVATDEVGSGMGLLIVHRLCRLHKGTVKVTSEENRGTTFLLTFPLNISSATRRIPSLPGEHSEDEQPAETDGRETVVLIDDDKEILDYLTDALSTTYRIIAFSDGVGAMEKITEINPDIVISDVKLQGLSGFELCQKLKGSVNTSHIPVILLSGLSERQNIILGLESGANDYIIKPFDISVLRLRVRNILKSRRELRERFITSPTEVGMDTQLINELDREFMDKVNAVLDEHLGDDSFSIADLCRDLAMSRTTIYNKIKALSGVSINEFIRLRRLNKARELLATRRYPVSEVAYMVGFSDPKYFSTCFKKQFGISPSKI